MTLRKKIAIGILGLGFFSSLLTGRVFAQDKYGLQTAATTAELPTKVFQSDNIYSMVGSIINIILSLVGIIFFLLIFYSGFIWMTAQGNTSKVEKAKETMTAAVIGLIIIMSAYAITNFVFSNLSVTQSNTVSFMPSNKI